MSDVVATCFLHLKILSSFLHPSPLFVHARFDRAKRSHILLLLRFLLFAPIIFAIIGLASILMEPSGANGLSTMLASTRTPCFIPIIPCSSSCFCLSSRSLSHSSLSPRHSENDKWYCMIGRYVFYIIDKTLYGSPTIKILLAPRTHCELLLASAL